MLASECSEAAAYMAPERREEAAALLAAGRSNTITVVLVAYRAPSHEMAAKTVDFSRASLEERWTSGFADIDCALNMLDAKAPTTSEHGFVFYDGRQKRP